MFDKDNKTEYSDDLIKSEQVIIREKDSGDKKFIYTILILLVILFIVALAVIGYLGSKFFGSNQAVVVKEPVKTEVAEPVAKKSTVEQKSVTTSKPNVQTPKKAEDPDIAELESIVNGDSGAKKANVVNNKVNSNVQKAIGAAASATTRTKRLTQEEMAKIAQLVAQELAKTQAFKKESNSANKASNKPVEANSEEALVKSLQEASTDTLKDEKVDVNKVDTNKVEAKANKKKVDRFNKVVVEQTANKDDEFAQLSSEIDSILAQDEVKQNKENKAITAQLQSVVKDREKEMRYIVVREGDTLGSLARRAYGRASAFVKIYKANPELVKNPNMIYVGMKLRVPVDEEYKEFKGKK